MYIPKTIKDYIKDEEYSIDNIGMSDSNILIFNQYVLKIDHNIDNAKNEYQINKWLQNSQGLINKIKVPKIYEFTIKYHKAYTLMEKINGYMLCDKEMMNDLSNVSKILSNTLKEFWKLDISSCPTLMNNQKKLEIALKNIKNGYAEFNVDEIAKITDLKFNEPIDIWNYLKEHPIKEELVFSHGDMCLPNVFYHNGVTLIDLGNAGICDKYCDIAIAYRSFRDNALGKYNGSPYEGYNPEMFFNDLGIEIDQEKLTYYLLLDELF